SRRRHTRLQGDWSSDVCSSDLELIVIQQFHRPQGVTGFPSITVPLGTYRALIDGTRREKMDVTEAGFEPRIGRSVSLDHAAEILGVSRRTIYNRIREGRLQTIRTLGGSQRVLIDSVNEIRRTTHN